MFCRLISAKFNRDGAFLMKLNAIKYLSGGLSLRVYGGFTENFMNDCADKGIDIWDVRSIDDSVFFFTREKFLPEIMSISALSGLTVQVNSRFGIPNILRENKRHAVLFAGILFSVLFVMLMNTRIWVIDVSGNDKLFDSEILSIMEDYGVRIGARKSKINAIEIQKEFLERTKDRVLWVSLNVEGMCAEIQIREIESFDDGSIGQPCNYVADFSGVITTCRVFSGTPVVSRGDYVRKGDMLISSVIEYYNNGLDFVESRGLIIARHNKYVNRRSDYLSEKRKYLSSKNRYSLMFFGKEIPLSIKSRERECESSQETRFLQINGVKLPFGISVYTDSFYEKTEDNNHTRLLTLKSYLSDVELQTRRSNVISVKTEANKSTDVYELRGEIDCLDFMGSKEVINLEG